MSKFIVNVVLFIPLILVSGFKVFTLTIVSVIKPIDDALGIIIESFLKAMEM